MPAQPWDVVAAEPLISDYDCHGEIEECLDTDPASATSGIE